jgi:hypothetical protein
MHHQERRTETDVGDSGLIGVEVKQLRGSWPARL